MAADKIFYNGQVFTMDPCGQICEAFAVSGDRLLYTGDCETAMTFKGDSTECIDLKGKTDVYKRQVFNGSDHRRSGFIRHLIVQMCV